MNDNREEDSGAIIPSVVSGLTKPASGLIQRGLQELLGLSDEQKCGPWTAERPRVLLVDDQEDLIEEFGPVLAKARGEVKTTLNVIEAIDIARTFQPHVAVLGLIMPVMDGVVLGMKLSDFLPRTKIVLWGEVDGSEDLDDLERRGYRFASLSLPIDKEEFLSGMQHCVNESFRDDLVTGFFQDHVLYRTLGLLAARRHKFSILFFDILEHWHQETATVSPRELRKVLAELAYVLKAKLVGPFYRYGENNFALILIQTGKDLAERKKNELSKLIHETDWQKVTGHSVSLTAKFAVVSFPEGDSTIEELIAIAMETLSSESATP